MEIKPKGYRIKTWCRLRDRSRASCYRLLNSGALKAVKDGKNTIITAESDEAWWQSLPAYQPQHVR